MCRIIELGPRQMRQAPCVFAICLVLLQGLQRLIGLPTLNALNKRIGTAEEAQRSFWPGFSASMQAKEKSSGVKQCIVILLGHNSNLRPRNIAGRIGLI